MKDNKVAIILNTLYWSVILILVGIASALSAKGFNLNALLLKIVLIGVIHISLFYINYLFLIPEFILKKKQYFMYLLFFIVFLIGASALKTSIAMFYRMYFLEFEVEGKMHHLSVWNYFFNAAFLSGFFMVSSALLRFTADWFKSENIHRNLQSERKEMEIQFLKSQLNPHFLFNSLNNIYSLAYKKSDQTADAIMKLSEIMRYMIYESNTETVSLTKEVEYLKSYIELQKIRLKDGGAVHLEITGDIDGQQIVPLMLISFVENAFKHGVATDINDPILVNLTANQKIIHFRVHNKKGTTNKDGQGGVGLTNVERRLQLMYPDRFKLNVLNTDTHYTTELMLDI